MTIPKVSVIVPVWNVAPYIEQCIESLRSQTLQDMEFIFIDDCGTDASMDIVERHAAEDARIRILHNKENLGPGPSRNAGIEAARGEYLGFVDPDDWVDAGFYEELYSAATTGGFDIVKGLRVDTTRDPRTDHYRELQERAANNQAIHLLAASVAPVDCLPLQHQAMIYARNIIAYYGIRNGNTSNAEDVSFLVQALYYAQKCLILSSPKYCYHRYLRNSSLTRRFNKNHYENELYAKQEQIDFICKYFIDNGHGYYFCVGRIVELLHMHNNMRYSSEFSHFAPDYLQAIQALIRTLPEPYRLERQGRIGTRILMFALLRFNVNLYQLAVMKGKFVNMIGTVFCKKTF